MSRRFARQPSYQHKTRGCEMQRPSLTMFAPWRVAFFATSAAFALISICHGQNWDRFRGPNGAGQSDAAAIPIEWTQQNYLWKQPLVGLGHSSPIVWGD